MRRAIVTGGAGFIGSHIVDQLLERNIETFVIDNLSTGSLENISQHKGNPLLHFVLGDIKEISKILGNLENVDVLFHEAAIASVPKSVEDPILVNEVNVSSTLEVLNYCRRNVRRVVFASSAAVYGLVENPPAVETMHCSPCSPYGASKLAVEDYINAYRSSYGLETVILRYFNVFGPRQKSSSYSGVITIFINALLSGKNPTIFGDGLQTRDFVHVRDIATANILAMESDRAPAKIFNVASGNAVTILELFNSIKKIIGAKDAAPKFGDPAVGDVREGTASIDKIKSVLGYGPGVTLEEGLSELASALKLTAGSVVYNK